MWGVGKRLRPVTETVPKPLVEISESYTILDTLFDFKNAGVNEVFLLAGFLYEKIEERYGSEFKGFKIHYVIEDEPLDTLNLVRDILNLKIEKNTSRKMIQYVLNQV